MFWNVYATSPPAFERLVVDVLLAMGYGGSEGRGMVTQASNDGGIDGVIDQDALGLSKIYVQAKRYGEKNSVGRPEVQSLWRNARAGNTGRIYYLWLVYIWCTQLRSKPWRRAIPSAD